MAGRMSRARAGPSNAGLTRGSITRASTTNAAVAKAAQLATRAGPDSSNGRTYRATSPPRAARPTRTQATGTSTPVPTIAARTIANARPGRPTKRDVVGRSRVD